MGNDQFMVTSCFIYIMEKNYDRKGKKAVSRLGRILTFLTTEGGNQFATGQFA